MAMRPKVHEDDSWESAAPDLDVEGFDSKHDPAPMKVLMIPGPSWDLFEKTARARGENPVGALSKLLALYVERG